MLTYYLGKESLSVILRKEYTPLLNMGQILNNEKLIDLGKIIKNFELSGFMIVT